MSYLHGLYLDSFQTTKRHSYDGYSIYISIFNSFFQGVYPVGVTNLRPYFTHIIGHNSVYVHRIPTKELLLRSALMSPLSGWGLFYGTERNGTERNDGLNCGTECFLRLKLAAYHCCTSYQWHFQQVIKRTPRKIKRI